MVLMVSLLIHALEDKILVEICFQLNVPEFQVGNSALLRGRPTQAVG
jgi:hypothetical protein